VPGIELQAREHRGDPLLELPAVAGIEFVVQLIEPPALGRCAGPAAPAVRIRPGPALGRPSADQLSHRIGRERADVLRQVGDARARLRQIVP
jgi:hypothetical protein